MKFSEILQFQFLLMKHLNCYNYDWLWSISFMFEDSVKGVTPLLHCELQVSMWGICDVTEISIWRSAVHSDWCVANMVALPDAWRELYILTQGGGLQYTYIWPILPKWTSKEQYTKKIEYDQSFGLVDILFPQNSPKMAFFDLKKQTFWTWFAWGLVSQHPLRLNAYI